MTDLQSAVVHYARLKGRPTACQQTAVRFALRISRDASEVTCQACIESKLYQRLLEKVHLEVWRDSWGPSGACGQLPRGGSSTGDWRKVTCWRCKRSKVWQQRAAKSQKRSAEIFVNEVARDLADQPSPGIFPHRLVTPRARGAR